MSVMESMGGKLVRILLRRRTFVIFIIVVHALPDLSIIFSWVTSLRFLSVLALTLWTKWWYLILKWLVRSMVDFRNFDFFDLKPQIYVVFRTGINQVDIGDHFWFCKRVTRGALDSRKSKQSFKMDIFSLFERPQNL